MKIILKIVGVLFICFVLLIIWLFNRYKAVDKSKSNNFYYTLSKKEIHYQPMGNWFELGDTNLEDLDVENAQILSENHIKDKEIVYFQGVKINNADVASFVVLDDYFAKDKNTVYYLSNSFEEINVQNFSLENSTDGYIRDGKNIYSYKSIQRTFDKGNQKIKALPKGYVVLAGNYGHANNFLYYNGKQIDKETSNKFEVLDDYTVKSDVYVYISGEKIINIDAASYYKFKDSYYFKDKNGVYYGFDTALNSDHKSIGSKALKIENVDVPTFEIVKEQKFDAKDKNNSYLGGKIYTEDEAL